MKLDKLFQSLLLTGAVVVLTNTPSRGKEVLKDTEGESSSATVADSRFKDTVTVRNQEFSVSKSPALASSDRKPRYGESQVEISLPNIKSKESSKKTLPVKGIERISQGAALLVQSPTPEVVQVTGVQATRTDQGVEVILQTTQGQELQITNRSADNNFIADIPNAQLLLPSGDGFIFRSPNPIEGITEITVTNFDANTIRVTVIGEAGLPTVVLFDSDEGLIFGFTPVISSAQTPQLPAEAEGETQTEQPSTPDQPIELVVTGQQDRYSVPNATTATRTDTPLRDIPQSIQAVPRQVLEDQQVIRASEALLNVSGVQRGNSAGNTVELFNIRGFQQFGGNLRDGFRDSSNFVETANLERIEVLKGPASVLYGNLDPGGIINYVTKQPLAEPFYAVGLQIGSFGLVRPTLDFSGPLNPERTVLYRLNAAYEGGGNFRNFDTEVKRFFISPVVSWKISDRTDVTFEFEYVNDLRPSDRGLFAFGTGIADIPFDRVLGEPDDSSESTQFRTGYRFEHRFNDDWKIRNRFRLSSVDAISYTTEPDSLNEETGELFRTLYKEVYELKNYGLQTDVVGKFNTGSIEHQLLFGVDLSWQTEDGFYPFTETASINIFNPVYGNVSRPASRDQYPDSFSFRTETNSLGFFLQDQVKLAENLKLLVGGRFDFINQSTTSSEREDQAFSPRVGIVYQPIEPISLYTSFSRSFQPNFGTRVDGSLLEPVRGTQYEVGIRGEFLNSRLTTNLAAYEITKSNLGVTDPDNPIFSIPSGEQRSRGIELDVTGQILPGWNMIASYAYTDARVTKDDNLQPGNLLDGVPFNSASLWSTYEIQTGDLQGLGFGLGLFYVGERQGDLSNSFQIPSYVRTDASVFYRRNNWRVSINVNNLFNVNYIEAGGQVRRNIDPGAPLTVRGRVSVEF
ncbi:TonB-dependent receptor [Nodularia sp. NIES-3585]|uniref:TonB-dependent receptor n=1 Tax=Nodularia sp. NIES-3585 TaxID=1973477 RepID=UPI000B5CC266|nr:TonB-dependent receptor [Nodularia sp. NIES-3585]GAX38400.1 ferrichrome-iron receptor [Nodularia sp. NIES-3585]